MYVDSESGQNRRNKFLGLVCSASEHPDRELAVGRSEFCYGQRAIRPQSIYNQVQVMCPAVTI